LASDEKVLASADVLNRLVLFSTFTPATTVACGTGGGTAQLYGIQMGTGCAGHNYATGDALLVTNIEDLSGFK